MKENILGPRQWAFVVITGGAACALPFVQTDNAPTPTDNALTQFDTLPTRTDIALTSSQHDPSLAVRYAAASSAAGGGGLSLPASVADIVPPPIAPHLPAWANAERSPFDDLVGVTVAKPQAAPPSNQLPMQPLRPWIAGPTDSASPASASTPPVEGMTASSVRAPIARAEPATAQASPWSDEPTAGFIPIDQLASRSLNSPGNNSAGADQAYQWPDQSVSAEELAQATRARERELASAIVAAPPRSPSPSSALLAAPALPPSTSLTSSAAPQTFNTMPVAAQSPFGQTSLQPRSVALGAPSSSEVEHNEPRKPHIIFQPGIRK